MVSVSKGRKPCPIEFYKFVFGILGEKQIGLSCLICEIELKLQFELQNFQKYFRVSYSSFEFDFIFAVGLLDNVTILLSLYNKLLCGLSSCLRLMF